MDKKFYGLIIPKKVEKIKPKIKSVFDSDSDDDDNTKKKPKINFSNTPKVSSVGLKVEDDPTIYEYDTVYEEMQEQKATKKTEAVRKQSRYIGSLLKAADKRKKDLDRRQERKIQVERVKEGDEFRDKESFVTSAYKQKMLEMEKEEEQERIKNQLEDMMDVTKQKDLSGFYRHYLKQSVGEEKIPEFGHSISTLSSDIKIEKEDDSMKESLQTGKILKEKKKFNYRSQNTADSSSEEETDHPESSSRHVSKRSQNASDHEGADVDKNEIFDKNVIPMANSQKKGDTKINSEESIGNLRRRHDSEQSASDASEKRRRLLDNDSDSQPGTPASNPDADDDDIVDSDTDHKEESKSEKQKNDISLKFVKRTVGEVFTNAQARYFKRLAARNV